MTRPAFIMEKGSTMDDMQKTMQAPELGLHQKVERLIRVQEEVQQSLATLLGYAGNQRVLLKASPSGILYAASPRLSDVVHYTAGAPSTAKQGDDLPCTEVLCMAHPDNTGRIWVRTMKTAAANNAFPLDKTDVIGFSVENLNQLHALIVANGDTLIVGYSL
jgi:hypothetical protein